MTFHHSSYETCQQCEINVKGKHTATIFTDGLHHKELRKQVLAVKSDEVNWENKITAFFVN